MTSFFLTLWFFWRILKMKFFMKYGSGLNSQPQLGVWSVKLKISSRWQNYQNKYLQIHSLILKTKNDVKICLYLWLSFFCLFVLLIDWKTILKQIGEHELIFCWLYRTQNIVQIIFVPSWCSSQQNTENPWN